jgi:hypothetical protein
MQAFFVFTYTYVRVSSQKKHLQIASAFFILKLLKINLAVLLQIEIGKTRTDEHPSSATRRFFIVTNSLICYEIVTKNIRKYLQIRNPMV